jgi:hypothetical protein
MFDRCVFRARLSTALRVASDEVNVPLRKALDE